jgi:hypothetical protein
MGTATGFSQAGNQESIKQRFKVPWTDDFDASEVFQRKQSSSIQLKIKL